MTQKAPERIKIAHSMTLGVTLEKTPAMKSFFPLTEYVRSDHALALVAAEREAWASEVLTHIAAYKTIGQKGAYPTLNESFINTIRIRTNADAQAALERMKQEARNEALREAAEATQEVSGIKPFSSVANVKSIISNSILALITEDQNNE